MSLNWGSHNACWNTMISVFETLRFNCCWFCERATRIPFMSDQCAIWSHKTGNASLVADSCKLWSFSALRLHLQLLAVKIPLMRHWVQSINTFLFSLAIIRRMQNWTVAVAPQLFITSNTLVITNYTLFVLFDWFITCETVYRWLLINGFTTQTHYRSEADPDRVYWYPELSQVFPKARFYSIKIKCSKHFFGVKFNITTVFSCFLVWPPAHWQNFMSFDNLLLQ